MLTWITNRSTRSVYFTYIYNVAGLPLYANGTTGTLLLLDETLVGESERNKIMIDIGLLYLTAIRLPDTFRGVSCPRNDVRPGFNCKYLNPHKDYRAGYQTITRILKKANCRLFHNLQMWMSESPFESYKSTRILFFTYLICPAVSGTKALRNGACNL